MAGAIGASIAVTIWDDHAKLARSEMVSSKCMLKRHSKFNAEWLSSERALGVISNLVDKEALTMSVNHVFLIFAMLFIFAGLFIWLSPKPKGLKLVQDMHIKNL